MKNQTTKLTISTFAIATMLALQMSTTNLVASGGTSSCPKDTLESLTVTLTLTASGAGDVGDETTATINGSLSCTATIKKASGNDETNPVTPDSSTWDAGTTGQGSKVTFTGGVNSCAGTWKRKKNATASASISVTSTYSCSAGKKSGSDSKCQSY